MTQIVYSIQFTKDWRAPKQPETEGGEITYRQFKEGDTVEAVKFNQSSMPLNYAEAYKTIDGFTVPQSHVYNLGEVRTITPEPNPEPTVTVEQGEVEVKPESPKKIKRAKSEPTAPSAKVADITNRSKQAINGAMIGAAAGLILAMMMKKNKVMFAVMGAAAGYGVGNVIAKNK